MPILLISNHGGSNGSGRFGSIGPMERDPKTSDRSSDSPAPGQPPESFWRKVLNPDDKRLEEDRQFWSKQYGREVTLAETSEIHHNLFGLVRLLMEVQARQDAIAAGQRVVDDKKVNEIRWTIRGLTGQIEALQKMIKRWGKTDPQRTTLEQSVAVLESQLLAKQQELNAELDCSRPPTPPAADAPSSDLPPASPAAPIRPAPRRSKRSSTP